jgi:hypothetical protein
MLNLFKADMVTALGLTAVPRACDVTRDVLLAD